MEREGFNPEAIPEIEAAEIDPQASVPEEHKAAQAERREREGSLAEYIHSYWRGDAHAHTTESTRPEFGYVEGIYDLNEMASYYEKLGLEFAAITEHSSLPTKPEIQAPDSPVSKSLLAEAERITNFNREHGSDFAVLSGVEANIMFDETGQARIDLPPEVTGNLDLVIASRHGIEREKDLNAIEASLTAAIEDPNVDVIGHPDRYLMNEYDWDFLRKNNPEAQAYHEEIRTIQKQKEAAAETDKAAVEQKLQTMYHRLRQGIGQDGATPEEMAADPQLGKWLEHSKVLHAEYDTMWDRLVSKMAEKGKAFDLNLTSQPSPRLVEQAAKAGVKFFVNFDAHDFARFKSDAAEDYKSAKPSAVKWAKGESLSPEDEEALRRYKADRLSSSPGVRPILRLTRWLKRLEVNGVTPDRVINSSRDRLMQFLTEERGKKTPNLDQLTSRTK